MAFLLENTYTAFDMSYLPRTLDYHPELKTAYIVLKGALDTYHIETVHRHQLLMDRKVLEQHSSSSREDPNHSLILYSQHNSIEEYNEELEKNRSLIDLARQDASAAVARLRDCLTALGVSPWPRRPYEGWLWCLETQL